MHPMMQRLRQQTRGVVAGGKFVRFATVPEEARPHLAKALQLEVQIGLAVRDGKPEQAEHLRAQARAAWASVRAIGV
jgi:hypothetical protein